MRILILFRINFPCAAIQMDSQNIVKHKDEIDVNKEERAAEHEMESTAEISDHEKLDDAWPATFSAHMPVKKTTEKRDR